MGGGERATVANPVIARSAGDEAIHAFFAARWIASLPLAMTGLGRYSPLRIQRRGNAAHPRGGEPPADRLSCRPPLFLYHAPRQSPPPPPLDPNPRRDLCAGGRRGPGA